MTQRREPIRSTALRRAAAGQRCALNLPNICNYNPETVVLAHVSDESFGRGVKADDTSGFHACDACHRAYDLRRTGLEEAELLKLVIRAMQRTLRRLVLMGVVSVPLDVPKPHHARATKPRKPVAERKPIAQRAAWPQGRKLHSRNELKRERTT